LILSTVAGLSTLLGFLMVFFVKKDSKKTVSCALGFAAGVMLSVSFINLLPEGQMFLAQSVDEKWSIVLSIVFMVAGILVALGLDRLVPHDKFDEEKSDKPHKNLFRVGFVSMLGIMLHNLPEGIATFMAGYTDIRLGITIAIAIAMHNIPEGIAVALPIYYATNDKKKAFKYTFLSGIAEPVGGLLAFLVLRPVITDFVLGATFALIAGIMLYICLEELIPTSRQYGHSRPALFFTFLGICVMPLSGLF
jgi:ZIP family zinc transporter